MIRSLSYPNWFCCPTLAAPLVLVVALIGNSHAINCHYCEDGPLTDDSLLCYLEDCDQAPKGHVGGAGAVCYSQYGQTGESMKIPGCKSQNYAENRIGGLDACKNGIDGLEDFRWKMRERLESPNADVDEMIPFDQYVERMWKPERERRIKNGEKDPDKGYWGCTCSKDSCNDEAFDKKNMEKISGKPSSNNININVANSLTGADSGMLILGLAPVLAALVPRFRGGR